MPPASQKLANNAPPPLQIPLREAKKHKIWPGDSGKPILKKAEKENVPPRQAPELLTLEADGLVLLPSKTVKKSLTGALSTAHRANTDVLAARSSSSSNRPPLFQYQSKANHPPSMSPNLMTLHQPQTRLGYLSGGFVSSQKTLRDGYKVHPGVMGVQAWQELQPESRRLEERLQKLVLTQDKYSRAIQRIAQLPQQSLMERSEQTATENCRLKEAASCYKALLQTLSKVPPEEQAAKEVGVPLCNERGAGEHARDIEVPLERAFGGRDESPTLCVDSEPSSCSLSTEELNTDPLSPFDKNVDFESTSLVEQTRAHRTQFIDTAQPTNTVDSTKNSTPPTSDAQNVQPFHPAALAKFDGHFRKRLFPAPTGREWSMPPIAALRPDNVVQFEEVKEIRGADEVDEDEEVDELEGSEMEHDLGDIEESSEVRDKDTSPCFESILREASASAHAQPSSSGNRPITLSTAELTQKEIRRNIKRALKAAGSYSRAAQIVYLGVDCRGQLEFANRCPGPAALLTSEEDGQAPCTSKSAGQCSPPGSTLHVMYHDKKAWKYMGTYRVGEARQLPRAEFEKLARGCKSRLISAAQNQARANDDGITRVKVNQSFHTGKRVVMLRALEWLGWDEPIYGALRRIASVPVSPSQAVKRKTMESDNVSQEQVKRKKGSSPSS